MQKDRHTHTPGTEMDQEATNPEFVEMSDLDEEEGNGCWSSVFEVLRALMKGVDCFFFSC